MSYSTGTWLYMALHDRESIFVCDIEFRMCMLKLDCDRQAAHIAERRASTVYHAAHMPPEDHAQLCGNFVYPYYKVALSVWRTF